MKLKKHHIFRILCLGLLVALFFVPSFAALAQQTGKTEHGVGKMALQVSNQVVTIPKLIAYVSYIVGAVFAVRGLLALRDFAADPAKNPITKFLGYVIVAALLISLPYTIEMITLTLKIRDNDYNLSSSSGSFSNTGAGK